MRMRLLLVLALMMGVQSVHADDPGGPAVIDPRPLSIERYVGDVQERTLRLAAADRVELVASLLWRGPLHDPDWQRPVILIPSPYEWHGYEARSEEGRRILNEFVALFTRYGYAVVVADVRGTGRSGGCQDVVGPKTADDFSRWVSDLAARSWSNGSVGAFGGSYLGQIVKVGLGRAQRALRTAVVFSALTSEYDGLVASGVPYWYDGPAKEELAIVALAGTAPSDRGEPRADPQRAGCLREAIGLVSVNGDMTPYFAARESRRHLDQVHASVLEIGGFEDFAGLYSFRRWFDALPTFHRGVIGQWGHTLGDRADTMLMLRAWFDAELLGLPTGIERWPVLQVQAPDRSWRAVRSFVDMGTPATYPLLGDGRLGYGAAGEHSSWREIDPTDERIGSEAEIVRGEVIFRSEPLPSMHLSGIAELIARIKVDRHDAHFVIWLDAVGPEGSRRLARGALSARHRRSLVKPTSVPIGEWQTYHIETHMFDAQIEEGSSLELRIAGGDDWHIPEGNGYLGTIAVDGSSVLRLPISDDSCGLAVAGYPPGPGCPGGVPS